MTADMEQQQQEYDDGGLPGPGAPTPLSALEVSSKHSSHYSVPSCDGKLTVCRVLRA